MNLHASLLPKYRGAAPINWAIVRGEQQTGVCLMQMDEGMDTGPVLSREVIAIGPNETAGELYARLGSLAATVVRRDLLRAVNGELTPEPQDDHAASMAPMLSKADGRVDWTKRAQRVHDHARGMTPWPGAHSRLDGKLFKVLTTRVAEHEGRQGEPGTVTAVDKQRVWVACGEGTVALLRGQVEGKKALDAAQLVAGRTLALGMRFES
jgi:methionyl-tRNA formyltransferase